jgi:FMN-dependent oxidoreductase (nitrilotriacetate monooxygenase family)
MPKRLILNAFAMNTASHIVHGLWRHPETKQRNFDDLDVWVDLAKLLEQGKFDALFLADVIGLYNDYRGGWKAYVNEGLQIPSNDPSVLISALAYNTEHLGLAFTSSTIQAHPFEFARRISTLDHLSNGRIAWNIVTNFQENAHRNFGYDDLIEHDERYRRGDEYIEVTYKLWEGSWQDDALERDTEGGRFSDPSKIHKINHEGEFFKVEGPHLPSPSPQRTPVLYQAGSSPAGRAFAARNAEGVFLIAPTPEVAKAVIDDTRRQAVAFGRRADDLKFLPGLTFVVGSTEEEALRKEAEIDELLSVDGQLAHMAGGMGIDLGHADHDEPITEVAKRVPGVRSIVDGIIAGAAPGEIPTVADLARITGKTTRVVGTPEQIADRLEEWQAAGVDGINVTYNTLPGSFAEFIEHVTPELQRRGLQQTEYQPGTLREKLFGEGPTLPDRHPARGYRQWETDPAGAAERSAEASESPAPATAGAAS